MTSNLSETEETQLEHHITKSTINLQYAADSFTNMSNSKPNQVGTVLLYGIPIVSLHIESQERLCLAQISNTLLKQYSYNEIHNRRVALGITCVQCTPVQLEILRRAGAMPVSSRRCGMITRREAERLCKSFLGDNSPPRLPEDFAFNVNHECAWGCRGSFLPARYNSSRAKCIKCAYCGLFFSPNKFIFHSHRIGTSDKYVQPDAANFNSWRRHMKLSGSPSEEIIHAWEDVKAMFNGGTRKRLMASSIASSSQNLQINNMLASPKRMKESNSLRSSMVQKGEIVTVDSMSKTSSSTFNHHKILSFTRVGAQSVSSNSNEAIISTSIAETQPIVPKSLSPPSRNQSLCNDVHMPFGRGFMMDYMWHAQAKTSALHFSNQAFPWMKRSTTSFVDQQLQNSLPQYAKRRAIFPPALEASCTEVACNVADPQQILTKSSKQCQNSVTSQSMTSAFRPVKSPTKAYGENAFSSCCIKISAESGSNDNQTTLPRSNSRNIIAPQTTIKESLSSDEEMVDIETTEEDEFHLDGILSGFNFDRKLRNIKDIEGFEKSRLASFDLESESCIKANTWGRSTTNCVMMQKI